MIDEKGGEQPFRLGRLSSSAAYNGHSVEGTQQRSSLLWRAFEDASQAKEDCGGVVAKFRLEALLSLSPFASGDADDLRGAEFGEAVDESYADLGFGGLAVWVSGGGEVSEGLDATHLRLDPASGIVSLQRFQNALP